MTKSLSARFHSKYRINESGCWIWTASRYGNGYGCMQFEGALQGAHRISWRIHRGEIPDGLFVCHQCDVKPCVNPEHLYLGTNSRNMKDRVERGGHWRGPIHGELNPNAKLNWEAVGRIRAAHAAGESQASIARRFNMGPRAIHRVVRGIGWRAA